MTDTVQPPMERNFRSAENDFRVGRVFNQAGSVLSRNLLPFCIVAGIAALPTVLLTGSRGDSPSGQAAMAGFAVLLAMVLNALSQAVILYGAFDDMRGRPVNMMESLRVGLARFIPVIGTALLMGILIMIASLLLVIPGLIVAAMLYVAMPVCVVERLGPVKSIGRSADLTKGNRWKIFGLWIVLIIITLVVQGVLGGIATLVGGTFIGQIFLLIWDALFGAFSAIVVVVAYRDLRVAKEGVDTDQIAAVFD